MIILETVTIIIIIYLIISLHHRAQYLIFPELLVYHTGTKERNEWMTNLKTNIW